MSRSRIKLSSLLLNSVVLVIMTIMVIEIEEKSESKSSILDLKPNMSSVCPTPDPGIFAGKTNHLDDSSPENQHPMIVPIDPTHKDDSTSDFVINNGCYQIANYPRYPKHSKSVEIPVKPKYKQ